MRPNALEPERIEMIRQLAGGGHTVGYIARTVGCARSTVEKYAPPGSFDRSKTEAATKAAKVDAAARRATIAERLLTEVESLLDDMRGEHKAYGWFGKEGLYDERMQPEPPPMDKRALAAAVTSLMGTHVRLVDHDSDGGVDEAKTLLHGFMDSVARRANDIRDEQPAE